MKKQLLIFAIASVMAGGITLTPQRVNATSCKQEKKEVLSKIGKLYTELHTELESKIKKLDMAIERQDDSLEDNRDEFIALLKNILGEDKYYYELCKHRATLWWYAITAKGSECFSCKYDNTPDRGSKIYENLDECQVQTYNIWDD